MPFVAILLLLSSFQHFLHSSEGYAKIPHNKVVDWKFVNGMMGKSNY
jgi:hypothetical protein